jgi:hypothetical protein
MAPVAIGQKLKAKNVQLQILDTYGSRGTKVEMVLRRGRIGSGSAGEDAGFET